ncbi:hypothetical protein PS627_02649 [Pseudomonas fluorescens]|nr:hypothetical protein PS627_02649 [Pseudomonas fluorescens]
MGVMAFTRSRLLRMTASVTLVSFLSGCLPGNLKSGADSLHGSAKSLSSSTGNLLASLGGPNTALGSLADATGIALPGVRKGGELRQWTTGDQASAERARTAFRGGALDDLPVYDPLKSGEAQRYAQQIAQINAKYQGRTDLTPDEMLEVGKTVVPLVRYLVKSRAYQASKASKGKVTGSNQGNASVLIPAGSTVEMVALSYCNDLGLPAPWRGEKLHLRSSADYMPSDLYPLYKALHGYAASHPAAHYQMQGMVWWLRNGTCDLKTLSDAQKRMIDTAVPGGMQQLSSYCLTKQTRDKVLSIAKNYIPAGAGSMIGQYQQFMAQANDLQAKADTFLNADLSNPSDILKLAQTAGFRPSNSVGNLLANPYLRQALPVLKKSGMASALTPSSIDDKAVATTLGVMEELGRQLGEQAGEDRGSLANYSELADGLYADVQHQGGASHVFVKVRNDSARDQVVTGSDFVLSSVNDGKGAHATYTPTQRLSIGPMQPTKVYPNEADADRRYSPAMAKAAEQLLKGLKGDYTLKNDNYAQQARDKCQEKQQANPGSEGIRYGDLGLGIIRDVVQTVPVVGNVLYAYTALTGKDWMTGTPVSNTDRLIAGISAAIPVAAFSGAARGAVLAGRSIKGVWTTSNKAYDRAGGLAYVVSGGIKTAEGVVAYSGDDACAAWGAGAAAVANYGCAGIVKSCAAFTGVMSAIGNLPNTRAATEDELLREAASRLEYALAPPASKPSAWQPEIFKTGLNLFK